MTRHHYQCLIFFYYFKIFFNQIILHPVLTHLTRFSVCNKFVWVKRNLEIKVVVDHHLNSASFCYPFVFIDGFTEDSALRSISITVYLAICHQLFHKFRSQCFMQFFRYIPQCVFKSEFHLIIRKVQLSFRCSSVF